MHGLIPIIVNVHVLTIIILPDTVLCVSITVYMLHVTLPMTHCSVTKCVLI